VALGVIFGATVGRAATAVFGMFGLTVLSFFSIKERVERREGV
jgi:hypothetical protein